MMMDKDRKKRIENQARLRELIKTHSDEVKVFCSHDALEFERLSGRSPDIPVERLTRAFMNRQSQMGYYPESF